MNNTDFDYRARVFENTEPCDISDDFTLPDYMPAVGRVISCTACAAPPALYLAGGSIEYAGGIRYRLLYESAEDSSLWCAELPAEYDIFVSPERGTELPSDPSELSELTWAQAENVTARITAPRRLTVRSRIRLASDLSSERHFETTMRGDTSDKASVKTLNDTAQCGSYSSAVSAPVACRDLITPAELGLADTDGLRIISSRADVMIKNSEAIGGQLECRGDLCASLLIVKEGEGERPRRISRKIPFSGTLPLTAGNIGTGSYASCTNPSARVCDDGISFEGDIMICAETADIGEVTYLKDIYSQSADCETAARELKLTRPVACFNGNATISASADLATLGLDSGMKLCDFSARITESNSALDAGKYTLSGKMKINLIADNGAELIPAEFESDFKYIADIPAEDVSKVHAIPSLCDLKCRIDGERLCADCELCVACKLECEESIHVIGEVNFIPAAEMARPESRILICYPAAGETLWDVAKRYRSDARTIADKNSIDGAAPDAPVSAKYLVI